MRHYSISYQNTPTVYITKVKKPEQKAPEKEDDQKEGEKDE